MNTNTAFIMFAVLAAFGLATVVIPILNEAHAIAQPPGNQRPACTLTVPNSCKTDHPGKL